MTSTQRRKTTPLGTCVEVDGGWRCDCGLVWKHDYEALTCEGRGHTEEIWYRSPPGSPPTAATVYEPAKVVAHGTRDDLETESDK